MTYRIERLGHQGDGIAEGPVFAPLTLPGDVVTGILNGTRLSDIRIETPSDDRVKPPCRHFKACGGCQLQHASDAFVADWKVGVVRAALEAHGPKRAIFADCHVAGPGTTARHTQRAAHKEGWYGGVSWSRLRRDYRSA